jgi:DNA polymerase III subunit delta'
VRALGPVPLVGHARLRARLIAAVERGSLPASLLLHGPRGVGKQRLALWLAQYLMCSRRGHPTAEEDAGQAAGCGTCEGCRYAADLRHPDLRWVFPRPRPKDADADPAEVMRQYADAIAERVQAGLLYAPALGTEGIFVATVRALVHNAMLTPALAARKVLVVGDAERMVPQEGADMAANAFLKLLEEPLADTQLILTSSEPGALLPTIRSRVVAVRVAPVSDEDVGRWVGEPRVRAALDAADVPGGDADRVRRAGGAPGMLLASGGSGPATAARALVDAARTSDAAAGYRVALQQGAAGARGGFTDMLDALGGLLGDRARVAVERGDERAARAAAVAVTAVEGAKARAEGNVSPQLVTAGLVRALRDAAARGI